MALLDPTRRGRILLTPQRDRRVAAAKTAREPIPLTTLALLIAVLPMFGQTFHYLFDLPPLYFLSKGWPLLTLPLTLQMLWTAKLPAKSLYMLLVAYTIGFAPLMSMFYFGNELSEALSTTAKILPFTYYFSFYAVLVLFVRKLPVLRRAMLVLGAATFVIMVILWGLVPAGHYASNPDGSKLFLVDVDRGYRIYMPMFFGVFFMFYLMRRCLARRSVIAALVLLACFVALFMIYKQKASIAAIAVVCCYIVFCTVPRRWQWLLVALGAVGGAVILVYLGTRDTDHSGAVAASLGGSLSVRQHEIELAVDFLNQDPMRWIFGVGTATRFSRVTLLELFGTQLFFLADIGWLGIIFEYGVLGAGLIVAVYVVGMRLSLAAARPGDPFTQALGDYVVYLLVTSLIYSAVFTPGEVATVTAISAFLLKERAKQGLSHKTRRPRTNRLGLPTAGM